MAEVTEGTHEIDLDDAAARLESGEAQLIDVRRENEYEAGHIPGAVNIPLDDLPARSSELDRDKPIVFICRSGSRSGMAAEAFRASGIDSVNLAGGIQAWIEAGRAIEPEDGEVVAGAQPDNS